jgi:hypothetical protein
MRLTMSEKRSVAAVKAAGYRKATKKEKTKRLDELVELTHYTRRHARRLMSRQGQRVRLNKQTVVVGDVKQRVGRERARVYDEKVVAELIEIWKMMDYLCGKRLQPALPELITVLERHDELHCDAQTRAKLLKISAATIDRLLRPERRKHELRSRARTRPGTLLKHQIRIRTFSDWDEQQPGFVEIDLVGHEGGSAVGDYCQTLDLTDIATTWTETRAVKNKAQVWVFEALKKLRENLPFPLLGVDSDNGGEFINAQLEHYCRDQRLTFTRSRPYRKNDNCFVEQKNYSVVRRAVGYDRYDTDEQLALLNELYSYLRLYTNFFLPTMKLKTKERVGSRVKKTYDKAQTPYQRVLAAPQVAKQKKQLLRVKYETLNPAALKRQLDHLQQRLLKTVSSTKHLRGHRRKKFWSETPAANSGSSVTRP